MPNVAELIKEHVTLTVDSIDRVYLNAYVPRLQAPGGVVGFLRQRGATIPSPALFGQITEGFKRGLKVWAEAHGIPWVEFRKGERKDDVVEPYRRRFGAAEGVVLVGVAQERATAWRAAKRERGGQLWFEWRRTSVCVNHYYVYFLDPEWGPGFLKVCGYAPYTLKLCLNGHDSGLHWRPGMPRMGQAPTGQARHRLRGARQRLPDLRRPGRPAGGLR